MLRAAVGTAQRAVSQRSRRDTRPALRAGLPGTHPPG